MPSVITILTSVLLATYCCHALPNPTMNCMDSMGMPQTVPSTTPTTETENSSAAAAAAAAAASSSGGSQNNNNCSPPPVNPCPPPVNPCPPPVNPCPPPVNPCPPPVNPCPPPVNPCPPPVNPCPPPVNPCPPPVNPCPPPFSPPPCSPSPNGPGSSSAAAAAAAAASTTGAGGTAAASASASASVSSIAVPNLQQLCANPTDVQQCSKLYSVRYQHTDFQKLHNKAFYIHYASKSTTQIQFDSASCFAFSCSQDCQTIMVKFMVESTTSITKIMWGMNSAGMLSYVKTSVKVISSQYAVLQDTFSEAQKVTAGSTTAVVSTQTEQLQQFISSSPYVLAYSDYENVLAMRRCSDSSSFLAVSESLYQNQQSLQTNAMTAIQTIMNFHQIEMSMCSTLTQRFSVDVTSIAITSASFEMTKTADGTTISGNKIERQDGNSMMTGETSVSRTTGGDVSLSSSTSTNINTGMPPGLPSTAPPPPSPSSAAAASASASASATGSS